MFSMPTFLNLGLLFIRLGLGIVFLMTGFEKITGGKEKIIWLGDQMQHVGMHKYPFIWGLAATISEFVGGMCLVTGVFARVGAFFLCCVMSMATIYHIKNGDTFLTYSRPLSYVLVLLGLICTGPGAYVISRFF